MARHTYLAQWVWNGEGWEPPLAAERTGALDLRSNVQCGTAVTPLGYGLFTYNSQVTISGALYLGLDNARISLAKRSQLNNMLGVTATNRDIDLLIRELLVDHGSPGGLTGWKPLRVDGSRRLHIRMAGIDLADETIDDAHPLLKRTFAVRRADYRRAKLKGVPLAVLRRWNGYDLIKYRVGIDRLLDLEDREDGWEAPATTISDNFNRADEALDAGPWVEVSPTNWTVTSNQVIYGTATSPALARHTTALSSDDHKASVTVAALNAGNGTAGPAARASTDASPNQDCYIARAANVGSSNFEFLKMVNATLTALDTATTVTLSLPDTVEIEVNNSNMIARFNGVQQNNFTDTSITGNLYCGINMRRLNDAVDDFSAEDVTAATWTPRINKNFTAINRASHW